MSLWKIFWHLPLFIGMAVIICFMGYWGIVGLIGMVKDGMWSEIILGIFSFWLVGGLCYCLATKDN